MSRACFAEARGRSPSSACGARNRRNVPPAMDPVSRSLRLLFLLIAAVAASLCASVLPAALGIPLGGPTRAPTVEEQMWWGSFAPASFDRRLASITESTGFGRSFAQLRGPARGPDGNNFDLVNRIQAG